MDEKYSDDSNLGLWPLFGYVVLFAVLSTGYWYFLKQKEEPPQNSTNSAEWWRRSQQEYLQRGE